MSSNNFPNIGYISYGRDFNFFQKYSVTATTFGGDTVDGYQPSMIITFPTYGVIFTNLALDGYTDGYTGNSIVEYSFNGQTVHGELGSNDNNISLTFENRVISLIWFRIQSGSSGPIPISVQAWGVR